MDKQEIKKRAKNIRKIRKKRILDDLALAKKAGSKKRYLGLIFVFAVFFGLIIYLLNVEGLYNVVHVITTSDYRWMVAGLACLIIQWMFETYQIYLPLKKMYPHLRFTTSIKSNMIGQLFNNITPFSSGGQPMQAYQLTKVGLKASDTFSALMMKFIVYQLSLFTIALVLLAVNFGFFMNTFQNHMGLVALGCTMNLIATVFIFVAGIKKSILIKISIPIIKGLSKIKFGKVRIIKDADEKIKDFSKSIENFSEQFRRMKSAKKEVIRMYIAAIFQNLFYFSITYMVYRAVGNSAARYIDIITVQTYLLLIMSFIPTPGSGLGAEGGFALLFNTIFSKETINMSILFWRMYTYYIPILVGTLFFIPSKRKDNAMGKSIDEIEKEMEEQAK